MATMVPTTCGENSNASDTSTKTSASKITATKALQRFFSIDAANAEIPMSSTLATEEYHQSSTEPPIRSIGVGTCGEIWAQPGAIIVWKRSFPGWDRDLSIDYALHRRVEAAFAKQCGLSVHIPSTIDFITPTNNTWYTSLSHGALLPSKGSNQERRPTLITERIFPIPPFLRAHLITLYCHPDQHSAATHDTENQDCLVRIYLGRRSASSTPHSHSCSPFSLRNFPLTLEKIDALDLPKARFAEAIAKALAVIHWEARVDGRDIEFVMGRAPGKFKPYTIRSSLDEEQEDTMQQQQATRRRLKIWVLDFNQCRPLSMDHDGCEKAAAAFWDNDPYYPRPTDSEETGLWVVFESAYLQQAEEVLEFHRDDVRALPAQFVRRVKEMGAQRFAGGAPPSAPPMESGARHRESASAKRKGKNKGLRNNAVDLDELLQQ